MSARGGGCEVEDTDSRVEFSPNRDKIKLRKFPIDGIKFQKYLILFRFGLFLAELFD